MVAGFSSSQVPHDGLFLTGKDCLEKHLYSILSGWRRWFIAEPLAAGLGRKGSTARCRRTPGAGLMLSWPPWLVPLPHSRGPRPRPRPNAGHSRASPSCGGRCRGAACASRPRPSVESSGCPGARGRRRALPIGYR